LNEDLTEAISLSHDLGHTPFGHAGERVLNELMPGGFKHAQQSLRVVDQLEYSGKGLNLSFEVRNAIVKHSKGEYGQLARIFDRSCATLEGEVVRISDVFAYVNHDIDDAIRANIISAKDIPDRCRSILGENSPKRIDTLVKDIVYRSRERNLDRLTMHEEIRMALVELRSFLFERVYENDQSKKEFQKAKKILKDLYLEILKHPESYFHEEIEKEQAKRRKTLSKRSRRKIVKLPRNVLDRLAFDFLAGMTDRYAISLFEQLFIPAPWTGSDLFPT
jgi:dGTPase